MVKLLDWIVCPQTCTLENIHTREVVNLSPRSMDVLRYLIEKPGEVVSSTELLDQFWSKSVIADHAIHNAIAELRSALGDSASNPRYIKTYPKRGYSLIVPLRAMSVAVKGTRRSFFGLPVPVSTQKSVNMAVASLVCVMLIAYLLRFMAPENGPHVIQVLPFENNNVESTQQFWADQLPVSLVPQLSKLPNTVIVSSLGDLIAEEYVQANLIDDIDFFLGGIIQQGNQNLRLQISLINAKNNSVVFSNQFEISSERVFDVHDEIGNSVVSALSIYLNEDQRDNMENWGTANPIAYSYFLEAGYYAANSNHRDLERAIENYQSAIAQDHNFINAYLGLARAASALAAYSHEHRSKGLHTIANSALREVTRLDSQHESIPELQYLVLNMEAGNNELVEEALRALILSGSQSEFVFSSYGRLLAEARLYSEATQFLNFAGDERSFQVPNQATWLYQTYFGTHQNLIHSQKKIMLERPDHIGILSALIRGLAFVGDYSQATYYLQKQMEIDEDGPFTMLSHSIISGLWGTSIEAANEFELEHRGDPRFNLSHGIKSFILGDLESGVSYWRFLDSADARRLSMLAHKVEMYFPDSVLEDPRYHELLEELGIGISWQRHLMESVQSMSSITGVNLNPQSVEAFETQTLLIKNNLWDHSQITYPDQRRAAYKTAADRIP